MYIQTIFNTLKNGQKKASVMLFESYRENGKQKRKTIANLSQLPAEAVEAIRMTLESKKQGKVFVNQQITLSQGKSFGAFYVFSELAKMCGLQKILGTERKGKLALLQIIARIISQSSRLHIASFYPEHYAIEEVLGIDFKFNEEHLYENLEWLAKNQQSIECELFNQRELLTGEKPDAIYLYDVTSSYLEGSHNELANWGYNRDKKKGKLQIVIGLMCDKHGYPISIEVFKGNTSDTETVANQVQKLSQRFGIKQVVFVGDKGMVKSKQIQNFEQAHWSYITTITKAQIETLISENVIDMTLFCDELVEVIIEEKFTENDAQNIEIEKVRKIRYLLRRNPIRAEEIEQNRFEKMALIRKMVSKSNQYLVEHAKAKVETQIKEIHAKIAKFKLQKIIQIAHNERTISVVVNESELQSARKLDGCYVIKTDVDVRLADKKEIHDRYKDLAKVESAFRTLKTGIEEIRPLYLRREDRTRGHVFVCMLAYILLKKFDDLTKNIPLKLKDKLQSINMIQFVNLKMNNTIIKKNLDEYNQTQTAILEALNLRLTKKL